MAIDKGNIKTSANYDVKAQKPLDGRAVRPAKADLIKKESWSSDGSTVYVYEGMQVYVQDEKKTYYLKDLSKMFATDFSGWELMGTGAGGSITEEKEVYIGSDEPPVGTKVWIDPTGTPSSPSQPSAGVEVIDNLESDSTTAALSANQGRVLKEMIEQGGASGGGDVIRPIYVVMDGMPYTDEQKAYNVETYNMLNSGAFFLFHIDQMALPLTGSRSDGVYIFTAMDIIVGGGKEQLAHQEVLLYSDGTISYNLKSYNITSLKQ